MLIVCLHFFNAPITAYFGEKLGTRKFLIITSAICAITPFLMFPLVKRQLGLGGFGFVVADVVHVSFYSLVAGFTNSLFPVHLRYSGISVAYQMCSAVAGGLASSPPALPNNRVALPWFCLCSLPCCA